MLISELEFGSLLTYCSSKEETSNTVEIKKSKNVMYTLKQEKKILSVNKFMSELISERIKNNLSDFPFKDFFGAHVLLVPVPKSSLMQTGSLWVSEKIAKSLATKGLGIYCSCLERVKAVQKSAYVKANERPKPIDHFNSLRFNPSIHHPKEIVLIDDIVTRGATLIGCASILRKQFPDAKIRAFVVMRTITNPINFISITQPCVGKITLSNGETFRNP